MISIETIKNYLLISSLLSVVTCTFIQKTKVLLSDKRLLIIYSLSINILFSIFFCMSFTNIIFPQSMWVGLFAFLGADTLYRSLEGKLSTYKDLREKKNPQ